MVKAFFFLVAVLHGGPHEPFAFIRLGEYPAEEACTKAAQAMKTALDTAASGARAQFACVASGKVGAIIPR